MMRVTPESRDSHCSPPPQEAPVHLPCRSRLHLSAGDSLDAISELSFHTAVTDVNGEQVLSGSDSKSLKSVDEHRPAFHRHSRRMSSASQLRQEMGKSASSASIFDQSLSLQSIISNHLDAPQLGQSDAEAEEVNESAQLLGKRDREAGSSSTFSGDRKIELKTYSSGIDPSSVEIVIDGRRLTTPGSGKIVASPSVTSSKSRSSASTLFHYGAKKSEVGQLTNGDVFCRTITPASSSHHLSDLVSTAVGTVDTTVVSGMAPLATETETDSAPEFAATDPGACHPSSGSIYEGASGSSSAVAATVTSKEPQTQSPLPATDLAPSSARSLWAAPPPYFPPPATPLVLNPAPRPALNAASDLSGSLPCRTCRNCWDHEGDMISPCACAGTNGYVHRECLEAWLRQSGLRSCNVCGTDFPVVCRMKPLREWKVFPACDHKVVLFILLTLTTLFLIGWLLYGILSALVKEEKGKSLDVTHYTISFVWLGVIIITWIPLFIGTRKHLIRTYHSWLHRNQHIYVNA